MTPLVLRWIVIPPPVRLQWLGDGRVAQGRCEIPLDEPVAIVIGPPGPRGPMGPEATAFEHVQVSAQSIWTVNHNRGARPVVTVLSTGGAVITADVQHISVNQFQVVFKQPRAGRAIAR